MKNAPLPDDAVMESPIPCDFKVGEPVTFTNDNGVKFDLVVRGFAPEPDGDPENPRFIYVFTDAWWFPVAASSLTKRKIQGGEW